MLSLLENREPEVRQITVVFCDLVGSTELSERLDPEDLRALIDAYRKACGAAITRYEGQVANYAGDGLMAFLVGRARMRMMQSVPCMLASQFCPRSPTFPAQLR